MSKDDQSGFGSRLWSGGGGRRESDRQAERPQERAYPPDEKVVPLTKPGASPDREYVAFEIREHPDRLHIVRATAPSRFPNYDYLLDMSFDHHLQSAFTLVYTFMIVEVTGWHLEPIVHAISFGNCERIREFHPKLHDAPAKGEPLIERIQIVTADEKLMNKA